MHGIPKVLDEGHGVLDDADRRVRLSHAFAVLLGERGVQIPATEYLRAVTLAPGGIALVAALSAESQANVPTVIASLADWTNEGDQDLMAVATALWKADFLLPADDHDPPATEVHPPLAAEPRASGVTLPEKVSYPIPHLLRIASGMFELVGHDGDVRVRLDARQLAVAGIIADKIEVVPAFRTQRRLLGERALDRAAFDGLVSMLLEEGVLAPGLHESAGVARSRAQARRVVAKFKRGRENTSRLVKEFAERELERERSTGQRRVPVVPIQPLNQTPLALGMVLSYAMEVNEGALQEHYAFVPAWFPNLPEADRYLDAGAVVLFSNYLWSYQENAEVSEKVKARNPANIIIHGGPNTPKYDGDVARYFADNPYVDVLVHGEGEATLAETLEKLAGTAGRPDYDLEVLRGVAGISYRSASEGFVRGPERDRLVDIDAIPSPYLNGMFEPFEGEAINGAIIETNRGCPYSCTYCDWGSATASRIRKFSLERIFAEFEWCAKAGVETIFCADANFGIFERDVQIAEKVAEYKRQYGYPKVFITNYAKNTVKHLHKIVEVMAESGILTEGLLSLQTMDTTTLDTIKRSNIKVEKYDLLAAEFREADLPLYVDLMLGLPGSTNASTREDFQQCIDREVNAKIFQTEVLINSPMNAPDYREEFQIKTLDQVAPPKPAANGKKARQPRKLIVSTSSFTQEDYMEMLQLRETHSIIEMFGCLRLLTRFARQERGIREVDLTDAIRAAVYDRPDDWPMMALAIRTVPSVMVPPVSWRSFIDEVGRYLIEVHGVEPGSALDAVLAAQHAVLPARGRSFPHTIELSHDVGRWYQDLLAAKDAGHRTDWTQVVPGLASYGPAPFMVDDTSKVCEVGLGFKMSDEGYADWELSSPISRTLPMHHLALSD